MLVYDLTCAPESVMILLSLARAWRATRAHDENARLINTGLCVARWLIQHGCPFASRKQEMRDATSQLEQMSIVQTIMSASLDVHSARHSPSFRKSQRL